VKNLYKPLPAHYPTEKCLDPTALGWPLNLMGSACPKVSAVMCKISVESTLKIANIAKLFMPIYYTVICQCIFAIACHLHSKLLIAI